MQYCLLSTWKMSYTAMEKAYQELLADKPLEDAIIHGVTTVENDENIHSVGYGGLPNLNGEVFLDAAFMNGSTMRYGAISSVKDIKNPIKVAYKLTERILNCYLTAEGAEEYARDNGFEFQKMLTNEAEKRWSDKVDEKGHDTVCFIGKKANDIMVGVSTSGLFMKEKGRVGDTPIIGAGYYADSLVGACAATGIGENIMRGCLSYHVVSLMKSGLTVQQACNKALIEHIELLTRSQISTDDISIIAIDSDGNFGAATTKKAFPFVYANDKKGPTLMVAYNNDNRIEIVEASFEWAENYKGD